MRTRSEENQLGRSGITIKKKKNEGEKEREKNMKRIGGVEKFMEFRGTLVKRNIDLFPPANRGTRKTSNRCY